MKLTIPPCVTFIASRHFRRTLPAIAALLLAGPACSAQRLVFANYMLAFQDYQGNTDPTQEAKIESYEREIREAQALGIDGFVLAAEQWIKAPNYPEPNYIIYAAQMFEAAARLNSGFKLMFQADLCCTITAAEIDDMMRRFANNPRYGPVYFRYKGRPVLTTFVGGQKGVQFWEQVRHDLATGNNPSTAVLPSVLPAASGAPDNAPMDLFLVTGFYWGGELPQKKDIVQNLAIWKNVIDGALYWANANVPGAGNELDPVPSSDAYAEVLHKAGKLYMAPVVPQFWGAVHNRYAEYRGGAGMRAMWMDAIERTHPEWVMIITWNDFTEATYISPIDDPNKYAHANYITSFGIPGDRLNFFHSHAAAGKLMAFYIEWYKTGEEPPIEHDSVYWFYRTQPVNYDAGTPPVTQKEGPVADRIYITSNLTAPADLEVHCGGEVSTVHLPAGSSDSSVPFTPGPAPTFRLTRDGTQVEEGQGLDPIQASPQYNNYDYSTGMMPQ
jgi:glucan endo-1,3-alpha-glucosidase